MPDVLPPYTQCVSDVPASREQPLQTGRRIQDILDQIQALPNPAARALLQECLQSLLSLYGDGLRRTLQIVKGAGPDGAKILDRILRDDILRGLLLVHDLHPLSLEERLHEALNAVRPYMQSHGGSVEVISLEGDIARLRLQGTCKTCPSSTVTLELAVRRAVEQACPDLVGFEVEGETHVPGHTR